MDKMKGGGGQKKSFCPRSGYKNCPCRGGGGQMAKFFPRSCWMTPSYKKTDANNKGYVSLEWLNVKIIIQFIGSLARHVLQEFQNFYWNNWKNQMTFKNSFEILHEYSDLTSREKPEKLHRNFLRNSNTRILLEKAADFLFL